MSKPTDQQAQQLCDAIHSLGDYEHVSVRAERGHLNIYTDEYGPVARFSPLGGGEYGLSFRKHTGREPMPFANALGSRHYSILPTGKRV